MQQKVCLLHCYTSCSLPSSIRYCTGCLWNRHLKLLYDCLKLRKWVCPSKYCVGWCLNSTYLLILIHIFFFLPIITYVVLFVQLFMLFMDSVLGCRGDCNCAVCLRKR